jgi:transcriptional regulator with XRE-family HTH domain
LYEKFETLLHKKGITSYRVSLDTQIAQSTFSDWKSGRSKPKADKLLILAKYFGVPVEFFLEGELE